MSNRSAHTTFATIRGSRLRALLSLALALASLAIASGLATAAPPPPPPSLPRSWNLSRDLLTGMGTIQAPTSPWTLGEWKSTVPNGSLNTSAFVPFVSTAQTNCGGSSWQWMSCWFTTPFTGNSGFAMVGTSTVTGAAPTALGPLNLVAGVPLLHPGYVPGNPGFTKYAAVKWTNPEPQPLAIEILGRISDIDSYCGNGIKYNVLQGTSTTAAALSNNLNNNSQLKNVTLGVPPSGPSDDAFQASTIVGVGDSLYFVVDADNDFYCDTTELDILIVSK